MTRIVTELGSAPSQLARGSAALGKEDAVTPSGAVVGPRPQGRQAPRCAPCRQSRQNTYSHSLHAIRLQEKGVTYEEITMVSTGIMSQYR